MCPLGGYWSGLKRVNPAILCYTNVRLIKTTSYNQIVPLETLPDQSWSSAYSLYVKKPMFPFRAYWIIFVESKPALLYYTMCR